jgi:hypothetical protein
VGSLPQSPLSVSTPHPPSGAPNKANEAHGFRELLCEHRCPPLRQSQAPPCASVRHVQIEETIFLLTSGHNPPRLYGPPDDTPQAPAHNHCAR